MEFLKEILGEELYKQVEEKLSTYNGDEANKEKQIKIGNLGSGEYVGKSKYDSIQAQLSGKEKELSEAEKLIADLKKGTKGNADLQSKITSYENENEKLKAQLAEERVAAALKIALLGAKATDVPYLSFKVNEKMNSEGKKLELDANGEIKGLNDLITGLKTQFPSQFETGTSSGKKIEEMRLPGSGENKGYTKADILKMPYQKRAELFSNDPEGFNKIMSE